MNDIKALADFGDTTFDEDAILAWAQSDKGGGLPGCSAAPFAGWLDRDWNDYDDGSGTRTNEDVLKDALAYWTGRE